MGHVFGSYLGCLLLALACPANGQPLGPASEPDAFIPIERVRYSELTFERFYNDFRLRDRPVIITDIPAHQQPCFGPLGGYNATRLAAECAMGQVNVKPLADSRIHRKSCGNGVDMNFTEFMELFDVDGGLEGRLGMQGPFFADWLDLRHHCGELWRAVRFPAYFTGAVHVAGPSFYIGQKGFKQSFHMDYLPAELWTNICRGRKRFRIVPMSVVWETMGPVIPTEWHRLLLRPDDWPLGMPVWEGEAAAGDLFWFPAGALHAADNLENTVGLVANLVDAPDVWPGPLSWVNSQMLKDETHGGFQLKGLGDFDDLMYDRTRRMPVYDELGRVTAANVTANGFPTWGMLDAVHEGYPPKLLESVPSTQTAHTSVIAYTPGVEPEQSPWQ